MKDKIFVRVKTHRVLTWQGKISVALGVLILGCLSWPLIRFGVTNYLYRVDDLRPASRVIVENWGGEVKIFEDALTVSRSAEAVEIWSIIFEDSYIDARKRHAYVVNAWAAGIDTSEFFLIPVPHEDPKTLHIALAVADTAQRRGWQQLTIVTADLHSARSRKAYSFAARKYGMAVTVLGIPLEGVTSTNWYTNSIGLSMAFSETIKKLYYDLVVF